ncbi:hypothetical protein NQ318_011514 [Aromia moschata]|uniref:Uncharacterized protein n=1 Tax=Aromia moschata TaxID=1265417 RepID=A0AAV8XRA3_9CUCU|nr:hypothetical protein NQ318_011514 [Aromia moschata]
MLLTDPYADLMRERWIDISLQLQAAKQITYLYTTGEGAQFMTRKAALKKLQLSLNDFREAMHTKGNLSEGA